MSPEATGVVYRSGNSVFSQICSVVHWPARLATANANEWSGSGDDDGLAVHDRRDRVGHELMDHRPLPEQRARRGINADNLYLRGVMICRTPSMVATIGEA